MNFELKDFTTGTYLVKFNNCHAKIDNIAEAPFVKQPLYIRILNTIKRWCFIK